MDEKRALERLSPGADSILWIPETGSESGEVPEWLNRKAAAVSRTIIVCSAESLLDEMRGFHDWVVADALVPPATVLNWLGDLRGRLSDEGCLWIRLSTELEMSRAGKPCWQWLLDLAKRQGFAESGLERPGRFTSYLRLRKLPKLGHRWRMRSPEEDDQSACRALFFRAFGHSISREQWHWKYAEGRGRATMALRAEQVIAHYGCVSRRILIQGREARALQICDVMVDPAERAVMTRTGAFFQVAKAAQEAFIGYDSEHELGYGFPNQRHMQLAEKMGLYDEVDRLVELTWATAGADRNTPWATVADASDGRGIERGVLDRLWYRMQGKFHDRILVVRDADYWQYRYQDNPQHEYVTLAIRYRLSNRIIGLAIVRREAEECKLLDVLAEPKHMGLLVRHVRQQSAIWGVPVLKAWITRGCVELLVTEEARCVETDVVIPLNAHARIYQAADIHGCWFLMMGDTDFL